METFLSTVPCVYKYVKMNKGKGFSLLKKLVHVYNQAKVQNVERGVHRKTTFLKEKRSKKEEWT